MPSKFSNIIIILFSKRIFYFIIFLLVIKNHSKIKAKMSFLLYISCLLTSFCSYKKVFNHILTRFIEIRNERDRRSISITWGNWRSNGGIWKIRRLYLNELIKELFGCFNVSIHRERLLKVGYIIWKRDRIIIFLPCRSKRSLFHK